MTVLVILFLSLLFIRMFFFHLRCIDTDAMPMFAVALIKQSMQYARCLQKTILLNACSFSLWKSIEHCYRSSFLLIILQLSSQFYFSFAHCCFDEKKRINIEWVIEKERYYIPYASSLCESSKQSSFVIISLTTTATNMQSSFINFSK